MPHDAFDGGPGITPDYFCPKYKGGPAYCDHPEHQEVTDDPD